VKKTLTRKFIYVLAAIAVLAMLIPAMAVPANAQAQPTISMSLVNPVTGNAVADGGYNIAGSTVMVSVTPNGWTANTWSLRDIAVNPVTTGAIFVAPTASPNTMNPVPNAVYVQGDWGDTIISCYLTNGSSNTTVSIEKKWGKISSTSISPAGSTAVVWNESAKTWGATANITDTVTGTFYEELNPANLHVAQGTILNWYLVTGTASVPMGAGDADVIKPLIAALAQPAHVTIQGATGNGHYLQTVSDVNGNSNIILVATGEEAVQVVVVPQYPFRSATANIPLVPEVTTYDFYTTEMEVVPQVRWAGEKIVLEKYWGPDPVSANNSFNGYPVKFSLQYGSVGALEAITGTYNYTDATAVWANVDTNGGSSCILTSSDTGVSNVVAALYATNNSTVINQHYFTVYWLKFEKLTLGDVPGKRLGHYAGLWDPPNPYLTTNDTVTQTLNVSQDALLRARVSGWFVSSNPSTRVARAIDPTNSTVDNPSTATLMLPAGRWILPDDWPALAGPNWQQSRMHWDIMNTPDGTSGSYSGLNNVTLPANGFEGNPGGAYAYTGVPASIVVPPQNLNAMNDPGYAMGNGNYFKITTNRNTPPPGPLNGIKILYANAANPRIASYSVIGPFSPGLELMTPTGWQTVGPAANPGNPNYDPLRGHNLMDNTVVPDGSLNFWDAPMPPAKIIFQVQPATKLADGTNPNQAGFFKAALKTDIYYIWLPDPNNPANPMLKVYTNPFYQEMIPAHEAIPAFINNGGYDWNSFDPSYGPYTFWQFINQNRYLPLVTSSDPSGHPTAVEVYSDNHGEAMVWLNGNWNLDLTHFNNKGAADVPFGAVVGSSTVQATADYPYSRYHQAIQSNTDTKTFTWGGMVLGTDTHLFGDNSSSNGGATRLVLSAGAYDTTSVTGVYPNQVAKALDKVVWVFVTDRDGKLAGVNGAEVDWNVGSMTGSGVGIYNINTNGAGLSSYNPVTRGIQFANGFLVGTGGTANFNLGGFAPSGVSFLMPVVLTPPTPQSLMLTALFNKFWGSGYSENSTTYPPTSTINGLNPANFAVAAIDVHDMGNAYGSTAVVSALIHSHDFDLANQPNSSNSAVLYQTLVDYSVKDPLDDAIRPGDANADGVVNMADVVAVERMILGLDQVTSNAILNTDGTVDMGTVVKVERTILGLK